MEYKDKKYILKKLMQDALTEEERIALQSSRPVSYTHLTLPTICSV